MSCCRVRSNPPSLCLAQLSSLKELAEQLKKQLSREKSGRVQTKLKALLQRRDRIKELSVKRKEELELSRMLCIFSRDVGEVICVTLLSRMFLIFIVK